MDIVLVQTPAWGIATPPLALGALTGAVRNAGYKAKALDLNAEYFKRRTPKYEDCWNLDKSDWFWQSESSVQEYIKDNMAMLEETADEIIATGTPMVGFSIYASCFIVSMKLCRIIKKKKPDMVVLFGGPHVSRDMAGTRATRVCPVDLIVEGEGEATLLELIERQQQGESLYDCPGIFFRNENNKLIVNEKRPLIKHLDTLPYSDFTDFNYLDYKEPQKLPIMSSRGCPNKCSFCTERAYWITYRSFSAERVFKEIQHQFELYPQLRFVDFQDSLVNGHIGHLRELAELIIDSDLEFEWAGQAVIRKEMDFELFKVLKESGCVCLAFGLETTSNEIMMAHGKYLSKGSDISKIVQEAHKAGLSCAYNFMFGLPGETEVDHQNTLKFVETNSEFIGTVNPSASFCGFSPSTPGRQEPDKFDFIPDNSGKNYWVSKDGKNTFPVRLRRFEEFCSLTNKLGIHSTYPSPKLLNREKALGDYYHFVKDYDRAIPYLIHWQNQFPNDQETKKQINQCKSI